MLCSNTSSVEGKNGQYSLEVCGVCNACVSQRLKRKKMLAAKRQAAFRARQELLSRTSKTLVVTDEEYFFLKRTLQTMRETGATPATARDPKTGRFTIIDV